MPPATLTHSFKLKYLVEDTSREPGLRPNRESPSNKGVSWSLTVIPQGSDWSLDAW